MLAGIVCVAALYLARSFVLLLVGSVSWIGYAAGDQATGMIEKLPDAARKLRQKMSSTIGSAPSALQNVQEATNELQRVAADAARKPGTRSVLAVAPDSSSWLLNYALAQSALLMSVVAQTPIVLLLAYFLLASRWQQPDARRSRTPSF